MKTSEERRGLERVGTWGCEWKRREEDEKREKYAGKKKGRG
jgi:hypothetical protein